MASTFTPDLVEPMNALAEQIPKPPKSAYEKLPRRLRRFVDEYVGGKSGAEAARLAGCKSVRPHNVACKLRRKPEIEAAIAERTAWLVSEVGIRQFQVVREMAWIATCDPRKLVNGEGVAIPLHELPEDIAACISSVEVEQISFNGETGTRYKYRFWDKNKALDKLGQYLKLWDAPGTKVNVDARSVTVNTPTGAEALSGAVRLLEQVRAVAAGEAAALGHSNGSVLPPAVRDEPQGRGAPLDVVPHSGSAGKT